MLAVGPSELTKNLLQGLAKDMAMRWSMVTDKPQEFLGRSFCRTPQGYKFGVSCDYVTKLCKDFGFGELKVPNTLSFEKPDDNDTILDESGQRHHRQLLGGLLWLDCPNIKNAVCQLSTHVGTATTRDEINIKRLLRYLMGSLACNIIVGCNLDVPGIAGTPQGSIVAMTDAVCVFQETEHQDVQLLTCDDCSVHGQRSRSGARETQGCESTHSPRGHESLCYAGLGDGIWLTCFGGAWWQSTSR